MQEIDRNKAFKAAVDGLEVDAGGFTIIEVILAGSIMIILCVGTLTVYAFAVKINMGNSIRTQAQSVLQKEIEAYRSAKFVPNFTDQILLAANNPQTSTVDSLAGDPRNVKFDVTVNIDNDPYTAGVQTSETNGGGSPYLFKEITISVVPHDAGLRQGWLSNLDATVTFQRVRAN
jgi:type II secretory pathway pseudopilin PulG